MSQNIHTTAIISDGAELGENVSVGAYSLIGPNVKIGNNTKVHSHVIIEGHTTIGNNNEFFQFSSIGASPQDLTYKGEPTQVQIGSDNLFREYVSVHRGTLKQDQVTTVGDKCLLMAYVHLGHDVSLGSHCILANSTNLAGHVKVGERVTIGGGTNVSQFVTLGKGAYIGGASAIDRDIPLFCTAYGNRARLKGINIIGLRRAGFSKQDISELVDFYRTMEDSAFSARSFVQQKSIVKEFLSNELNIAMADFINNSELGIAPFMS